ncbi:hypothetical protein [Mesorhizobium marinum]|uniref:hypothetical protein n=1 Tax=Mesorhizobium marinum TaxID=3228790 RepID=UPI003465FB41
MGKVLAAFCASHKVSDNQQREAAAIDILRLFEQGFRDGDALLVELEKGNPLAASRHQ